MASIAEMQAIASVKMDIVKQDASRRCERWPDEPDSDVFSVRALTQTDKNRPFALTRCVSPLPDKKIAIIEVLIVKRSTRV
jgi:hypothetical protein